RGDVAEGVDVSHRGGKPGFVRVTEEGGRTVLTSPDFRGNFAFNTLGNIQLDPRSGVLIVEFSTGKMLSLTGEAEVIWDGPELAAFAGAQRLLRFSLMSGHLLERALPLRWTEPEQAVQLRATGAWPRPEQVLAACNG